MRGLEIKTDTYALIKVIMADGTSIPLLDQSTVDGTNTSTSSFLLQSVQEARMEKHQIVETFGDSYIFFFGEAPRFIDVTATLINSNDFNWAAEWWANYDSFLRGTKSTELGARTYLFYDDVIVEGYMVQSAAVASSDQPLSIAMNFRLFVTNYQNISFVGDPDFPTRASANLPSGVSLTDALNGEQINQLVGSVTGTDSTGSALGGFDLSRQTPLRSKISDNLDEWTGIPDSEIAAQFGALQRQIEEDLEDAADTLQSIITQLRFIGVNVQDPVFMMAMGFGPSFSQFQGFGIGAGAGFSATATFGAVASFSTNSFLSSSIGFGSASTLAGSFGSTIQNLEAQQLAQVEYKAVLESRAQLLFDARGGAAAFLSSVASQSRFAAFGTSSLLGITPTVISPFGTTDAVSVGASFGGGVGVGAATSVGGLPTAFAMSSFDGVMI